MDTQRPTEYDDNIAMDICWKIAIWPWEFKTLLEHHKNWPNKETLKQWVRENPEFAKSLLEAIEMKEEIKDKRESVLKDEGTS